MCVGGGGGGGKCVHDSGVHEVCVCVWGGGGGGGKCKVATRRPPQLTRYNGVHRAQRVEGSVHDSGVHEVCVCVGGGGGGKCKVATRRWGGGGKV